MKIVLLSSRCVGVPSVQRLSRFCVRGVLRNELLITYMVQHRIQKDPKKKTRVKPVKLISIQNIPHYYYPFLSFL